MSTANQANQALQQKYEEYQSTANALMDKISQLTSAHEEHSIVVNTLRGVPGDRKCFRMVGGVLVEKNAGETLPVLEQNMSNLETSISQLKKEFTATNKEFEEWKKKSNIKVVRSA